MVSVLGAVLLKYSNYCHNDLESCGSFFTSLKHISKEHYHDFFELCLITDGEIFHIINGKKQKLHAGSFLFIRPTDIHYFEATNENYFQYLNLALLPKAVNDLLKYLGDGFNSNRFLDSKETFCAEVPKSELNSVVKCMEYFIIPPKVESSTINSDLRATLVSLFAKYFPNDHWNKKTMVPIWLYWLYREMQKQDNFVGGLPTMQRLACKTPEHLCREFKKYFNTTPTDFINTVRLDYAKNLLVYSDRKIIDIATECGFESLSHFYHLFKKKYLLSPKEYRKLYSNIIGSE